MSLKKIIIFILLTAPAAGLTAAEISVPLQLGTGFFQQQIATQVFVEADRTFTAWDDGSGCNSLVLSNPEAKSSASGIHFEFKGEGRVGSPVGDICLPLLPWTGNINVLLRPTLVDNTVQLVVADSNIHSPDGKKVISGAIWNWTKQYVHPRLRRRNIDFNKPLNDIRLAATMLLPASDVNGVRNILSSLRISQVATNQKGMSVMVRMQATASAAGPDQKPEAALSQREFARLDALLRDWDVLVTLIAKQAAISASSIELRTELLTILLDARHDIIDSLTTEHTGQDPVRALFLSTWSKLSPVLRQISVDMPGESALDFAGFIGAVDALQAIDAIGPSLNLEISTNGLRRLARLIAPTHAGDPLRYDNGVDPDLRRLFDLGAPLELPPPEPIPPSSGTWLINSAWAQAGAWDRGTLFKLNKWIPTENNLQSYLMRVQWLLEDIVYKVLRDHPLEEAFREIFYPLMLATAWQETCWRQFIEKDGEREPLRSSMGAVGIMQVSPRVWRGFYHPNALTWNINYNAHAGGEILHHYLTRYALRKQEHEHADNIHDLARATYAAYNGGPSHLARYRSATTSARLKRIDKAFWRKYKLIRGGDTLAVKQCYG